jgi:hypothetical protein
MPCFSTLHYLSKGNCLTVKSIKTIQWMRPRCYTASFAAMCRLLALLLAFASAAPALHAQEWDHLNGRDKAHDPTGRGL